MNSLTSDRCSTIQHVACGISTRFCRAAKIGCGSSSTQFPRTSGALRLTAPSISSIDAGLDLRVYPRRMRWAGIGAPWFIPMTYRSSSTDGTELLGLANRSESEARLWQADGGYRWFLIRNVPLRDESGNIVKWYGTSIDIEDRKQAEDALRQSQAYLSEAQRLSHTGSFSWKVSSGEIFWSEEMYRIFQCERTTKPSVELAFQRTHPEDALDLKQVVARASEDGKDFDFEHRLLMPDGSVKYVHVVAHGERGESGEFEFVGALMDVTAVKEAEGKIKRAEEALRQAQADLGTRQPGDHHGRTDCLPCT